jgi:hypothetical protein
MSDSAWIRAYNNKSLWVDAVIGGNGGLTIGYGGATPPSGGAIIANNVGIGTSSPQAPLHINSDLATWGRIMRLYDPNMNTGDSVVLQLGKADYGPAAEIGFLYKGDQTSDNILSLGHYGNSSILNIRKDGFVGIGTTAPQQTLHIKGNAYFSCPNCNVHIGVKRYNDGDSFLHMSGILSVDGAVKLDLADVSGPTEQMCYNDDNKFITSCPSCSRRYKEDIKPLSIEKEKILSLQPVDFKWKNYDTRSTGLIAEDVYEKFPELVYSVNGEVYGVHYDKLGVYLIPIIKEQEKRIDILNSKIDELQKKIEIIRKRRKKEKNGQ